MKYKALCFDLDGTIMKTDPGIVQSVRYASEKMNLTDVDYDRHDLFIGPSLMWFCQNDLHLSTEDSRTFIKYFREEQERIGMSMCTPFDGMVKLLCDAQQAGYLVYVCTSKIEREALKISEHFGFSNCCVDLYGALHNGEEKSDILRRLLDREDLLPSDVVMIGDRYTDLDGGKLCKTHTIGVLYGYGTREEIEKCKPDHIVENAPALRELLLA